MRDVVGDAAEYVVNERYEETNSLYSLWLAREWVRGPLMLLNCDCFFHPEILGRLLEEGGSVLAYDSTSSNGHEQTKVAIRERRVLDLGKDVPAEVARGESLGMLKFDAEGAKAFFESAQALIEAGHEKSWVTEAVRTTCSRIRMYGVNVAGLPWAEIDFPYDLERARRDVWPAIRKSQRKRVVLWKRVRAPALALTGLLLAAGAWFSSAQVGPASVEAARLEFRLLLAADAPETGKYVVQIALDHEPYDWAVFTATPDSAVALPGFVVGDRDRIELQLPPGNHTVGVTLLAGTDERLLARVRRPE